MALLRGMGVLKKIPVPFNLFAKPLERKCNMDLWILALRNFIHTLGTVVRIGGILITLLVILPGAKTALKLQFLVGKLMKGDAKRFTPMANISILGR